MRPILFELLGVPFASWYVFFALAGIGAFLYGNAFLARASRYGSEASRAEASRAREGWPALFAVCYVAGWLGARAFSIWREQLDVTTAGDFLVELGRLGPMTFYGGALGAVLVGVLWALWKGLPLGILFDVAVPAGALALGLGRIGCHLNGDDFGAPVPPEHVDAWWAVTFPSLADGVARYPVQLEEACFSIALAGLAAILFVKTRCRSGGPDVPSTKGVLAVPGRLGALCALLSAAHRFGNEFFRGDPRGSFLATPLSTSQGLALFIFLVSAVLLTWPRRRESRPPESA